MSKLRIYGKEITSELDSFEFPGSEEHLGKIQKLPACVKHFAA